MATPRITPTVTPTNERHAADQAIDRMLLGIAEREAIADVATHHQLSEEAQLRLAVTAGVGITARRAGDASPISLIAGESLAIALSLLGRASELCRVSGVFSSEQVRTVDEAGVILQQLLVGIVDSMPASDAGPEKIEAMMRRSGEAHAGVTIGRLYLKMTETLALVRRNQERTKVSPQGVGFGGKAGN